MSIRLATSPEVAMTIVPMSMEVGMVTYDYLLLVGMVTTDHGTIGRYVYL